MLIALTQALVHSYDHKVKINKNIEDMNYEILNDAFWKAMRFDFDSDVTDCYDGQKLTLKNYIDKMIDNIYSSLDELGNLDVIDTVNDILENGSEADEQISIFKNKGIDELCMFLMDNVEYKI